jgi:O-antigen/teichoic acid export membrane protein
VRRDLATRRGGAVRTTVGVVAVAGSIALMLAAGPRLIGTHAFSGLGLAWTVSAVFGFGLAAPTEQLINRRLNARVPRAIGPPMTGLLALAAVAAVGCIVIGRVSSARHAFDPLVPAMLVAIAGWLVLTYVRGRLAGAGDMRTYAIVLISEALARSVLVAIAALNRANASWLLGAAVGVPLFVAAAVATTTRVARIDDAASPRTGRPVVADQIAFMIVSLGFQACLNLPALLVGWRARSQDVIGAFVAANTYFRAPTILMGGIATYALVALSHAWGAGDFDSFRRLTRRTVRGAALATGAAVLLVAAAEPVLLRLYYGRDPHLPGLLLTALAVSSVLTVIGGIAVQPLLAMGRDRVAAGSWLLASAVTSALVCASNGTDAVASIGLIAGPAVAVVVAIPALRRAMNSERP